MTRSYKKYKVRINVIIASTIFSWLCLSLRLFQIQILNGAEYKSAVLLQSQRKHVTIAERGNFFDRDNRPLSRNLFHYTLSVNPKKINDKLGLAREISAITNKPIDIYLKKLNSKTSFEYLERNLKRKQIENFNSTKYKEVNIEKHSRRFYPS